MKDHFRRNFRTLVISLGESAASIIKQRGSRISNPGDTSLPSISDSTIENAVECKAKPNAGTKKVLVAILQSIHPKLKKMLSVEVLQRPDFDVNAVLQPAP